jgi:putative membrane protein insertion efficiency factor
VGGQSLEEGERKGENAWPSKNPVFLIRSIDYLLKAITIFFVKTYQLVLSPMVGPQCRFTPTCSNYALDALRGRSFFIAMYLISKRIIKCNPFFGGGHDPLI